MNKRYIIPLLLAFMAHFMVMAVPYCDVRKFSITDGLAANTISDIKQTPDKLMWFATWNGLSYYDGYSFHTFRDKADDVDMLSTNRIISIYPTSKTISGVLHQIRDSICTTPTSVHSSTAEK